MALEIIENVSLSSYTTLQIGGVAQYFGTVYSEEEMQEAVLFAKEHDLQITVLAGGSNVLISDEGVLGLVILMNITGITSNIDDDTSAVVSVGAGEALDAVVQYAVGHEYWGLENLSHIPGSVGAAPVQNVGAYGVEVQDVIESVRAYDIQEEKYSTFTASECTFGYRDSFFKTDSGKKYIVTSVTFRLSLAPTPVLSYKDLRQYFPAEIPSLTQIRDAVIEIRASKFPDWHTVGTAGSFFKNPVIPTEQFQRLVTQYPEMPSFPVDDTSVKIPLGWILDKVLQVKGAGTQTVGAYKNQALVLINLGNATAADVLHFASHIAEQVKVETDIEIQWEVTRLGEW